MSVSSNTTLKTIADIRIAFTTARDITLYFVTQWPYKNYH